MQQLPTPERSACEYALRYVLKGRRGMKKTKVRRTRVTVAKTNRRKAKLENTAQAPEPANFAQVRKNVAALVGGAAEEVAKRAMDVAKEGQLAPAKYFFEAVGLYPATAETTSGTEASLAYTLLKRLGLPTEPLIPDGGADPSSLATDLRPMSTVRGEAHGAQIRNEPSGSSEEKAGAPGQNGESRMP